VLGVPFLPPAAATGTTNRLRAGLGRLRSATGPPPVQILESLFGLLDHRVLVALCTADVPDQLTGPMTIAELARRTDSDPERLERLVRFGSTRGWLRIDRRGRVRPTRVTAFLRTDHPGGWRSWVDFAGGDDVVRAVGALSTKADPVDAFTATNGQPFFEWMATHPERGATFDRAMAAGGRMHALALAAAIDWSTSTRVCDVGGGTGDLMAALLDLEPTLVGTVLDTPEVIARAVAHPRLAARPGDAFVAVPPGFDTYLLVNVLHDWSDEDAVVILQRVAEVAAPIGSRVIVVEGGRPVVPRDDLSIVTDVLMAALTNGGRERSPAAFAALGRAASMRLEQSVPLASGDLAHEFR
jgi:SAM-dependent methyltransferase